MQKMNQVKKQSNTKVVLAFSGGLDTCYCLWDLVTKGYEVYTAFVDSGGVSAQEKIEIAQRANLLGAHQHHNIDIQEELWDDFVKPLVWSGAKVLNEYPLLCSDRYLIVSKCLELCDQLGTNSFAHGCTGMGNDQMRFDLAVNSLGNYQIIAPIRELQNSVTAVRDYEIEKLSSTTVTINTASKKYSINENLLGVTISGSEIDQFSSPEETVYQWCKSRKEWPQEKLSVQIEFEQGVAKKLNNQELKGSGLLKKLNDWFGSYGVGKHIYTGDVILGLKGRIAFECPGIDVLQMAHKALNDAVNTKLQNQFHQQIAQRWAELVYSGFYFDAHKSDLEAYLKSSQQYVTGVVTIETEGAHALVVSVDSDYLLVDENAVYAQQCNWSAEEAVGFIKLTGQSTVLAQQVRNNH